MHPLARWFLPIGIGLIIFSFLWWLFQPFTHYLGRFWPQIAIAIGLGLFLWRFPLGQAERVWQFFTIQPVRGILTAAALTAMYGAALWAGYIFLPKIMMAELGVSQRMSWLLVTIIGLPAIPAIWRLYAITGIPGDPIAISRNFRILASLLLIFFGWWFHTQPNILFDHKTGASQFYVADQEQRIYFSPGVSPATGERLRPGTPEDAKKFAQKSWLLLIESWWAGKHASHRQFSPRISKKQETREVQLHPGVWTAAIYPPPTTRRYHINAPDGTIIQYSTGSEKTLPCSLGKKPRGAKWFKLRHPTQGGEVVVVFDKV